MSFLVAGAKANSRFSLAITWSLLKVAFFSLAMLLLLLFNYQQQRLDLVIYDAMLAELAPVSPEHTVLIEIDDKSLMLLGEWPWSRELHADLLSYLSQANAAAVGFDILFVNHSNSKANEDQLFADAIAKAKNVVLPIAPTKVHVGGQVEMLPQAIFASHARQLGHVDFEFDVDGLVRRSYLYAGYQSARWPSFALALAQIAKPEQVFAQANTVTGAGWTRQQPVMINYSKSKDATRLSHYSYADVLTGKIPKRVFKDKVVLIGMNATAKGDQFPTPITAAHQTMPGVEINAHLVNSLINQNNITRFNSTHYWLLSLAILIITLVVLLVSRTKTLLPSLMLMLLMTISVTLLCFHYYQSWLPPVTILGLQFILFAVLDLIKNTYLNDKLSSMSEQLTYDSVTGLLNEPGFLRRLAKQNQQPQAQTLLLLQIGKFKGLQGVLDERTSELLLELIKVRISQTLHDTPSLFARIVGSEFALVIPASDENQIEQRAQDLITRLAEPYHIASEHYRLPVYLGIVANSAAGDSAVTLLNQARTALKYAKESYSSNYQFYSHALRQSYRHRTKLESDLTLALSRAQLEVYYQPQVCSVSGKIIGAEALLRWQHHEQGFIRPDLFIAMAENNGSIFEIGRWVLQQACAQAKRWQMSGHPKFRIAVNLSPAQFADTNLVRDVKAALNASLLEPKYLELELTETGIIEDMTQAIDTLQQLKQIGVQLAIDDFGTGYASLSYLKQFPIDRIKIDRSFIHELDHQTSAQELAGAIVNMAHNIGISVIAEGVETEQQQHFLQQQECEELQGYFFSRPVPAKALSKLL